MEIPEKILSLLESEDGEARRLGAIAFFEHIKKDPLSYNFRGPEEKGILDNVVGYMIIRRAVLSISHGNSINSSQSSNMKWENILPYIRPEIIEYLPYEGPCSGILREYINNKIEMDPDYKYGNPLNALFHVDGTM